MCSCEAVVLSPELVGRPGWGQIWGLAKLGTDLEVLLRILLGPTFRTGTPALPRYAPRSVTIRLPTGRRRVGAGLAVPSDP